MRLLLLRHGEAGPASNDFERMLTAQGEQQVRQLATAQQTLFATVGCWVSSPYLRAQQTALLVQSVAPGAASLQDSWLLQPETDPVEVCDWLLELSAEPVVLLVGHNPLLSNLLNRLIGAEPGYHYMDTGSLAVIDFAEVVAVGCGELKALIT